MKENHQSNSKRQSRMPNESVSWMSTLLMIEKCIIPLVNVMKLIFAIIGLIFGFPWLYLSAFIVERKPVIDYSWSEVWWRCFGGVGFLFNGIVPYIVASVLELGHKDWNNGNSVLAIFLGYGIGMGLLIICQAFLGRWREEKYGPGGGQKAVQRFYLYLFNLLGLDTEKVQPKSTSWIWAFSLLSLFLGSIFHSVISVIGQLNLWNGVIGQCSEKLESCDSLFNTNENARICRADEVVAMFKDSCHCCRLMVNDSNYIDILAQIGGLMIFYYGIFQVIATLFVWAEKGLDDDNEEEEKEEENANQEVSSC